MVRATTSARKRRPDPIAEPSTKVPRTSWNYLVRVAGLDHPQLPVGWCNGETTLIAVYTQYTTTCSCHTPAITVINVNRTGFSSWIFQQKNFISARYNQRQEQNGNVGIQLDYYCIEIIMQCFISWRRSGRAHSKGWGMVNNSLVHLAKDSPLQERVGRLQRHYMSSAFTLDSYSACMTYISANILSTHIINTHQHSLDAFHLQDVNLTVSNEEGRIHPHHIGSHHIIKPFKTCPLGFERLLVYISNLCRNTKSWILA